MQRSCKVGGSISHMNRKNNILFKLPPCSHSQNTASDGDVTLRTPRRKHRGRLAACFELDGGPRLVMVEEKPSASSLKAIRQLRISLVDELEDTIDSLLDALLRQELFGRDDREEVLCLPGPRARTRKVLDILEAKGEEAASFFLALRRQQTTSTRDGSKDQRQFVGMRYKQNTQIFRSLFFKALKNTCLNYKDGYLCKPERNNENILFCTGEKMSALIKTILV